MKCRRVVRSSGCIKDVRCRVPSAFGSLRRQGCIARLGRAASATLRSSRFIEGRLLVSAEHPAKRHRACDAENSLVRRGRCRCMTVNVVAGRVLAVLFRMMRDLTKVDHRKDDKDKRLQE